MTTTSTGTAPTAARALRPLSELQALESEIMEEKVFEHLSSKNTITQG